jgi:hypothetical protein
MDSTSSADVDKGTLTAEQLDAALEDDGLDRLCISDQVQRPRRHRSVEVADARL